MKAAKETTDLSRSEKLDMIKGLLTGKKAIDEVLPTKTVFIHLYQLQDDPGIYYDRQTNKSYTEAEKDELIESIKETCSGSSLCFVEIATYKTKSDVQ